MEKKWGQALGSATGALAATLRGHGVGEAVTNAGTVACLAFCARRGPWHLGWWLGCKLPGRMVNLV